MCNKISSKISIKEGGGILGGWKGITVEIGGDTTKLQTALKGVNCEYGDDDNDDNGDAVDDLLFEPNRSPCER